ncbi:tRNA adenosine(34) deaminase TadA [Desulfotalea psychrophila]|uniref:tRNA-specific adenosine deaminase n=1 Tax=Desulfotalea psychrophila (strain LSv54 / DSM 12343) TaxID=177439 RepID=Q6ANA6_DESPS|nr:tRNA adenosine(34) deaminase TadA [Desulfotalea psychrophila]CAG36168.1 conserved hypothetical protein [Desulfotalea psychrophila LSv54]
MEDREIEARDALWMGYALDEAARAGANGEVPVGAVLVQDGELIATGLNGMITHNDPSAHAEIVALRQAGQVLNNYRFPEATLYVTLEPCIMCMGAIIQARIKRLVFAAFDTKTGAAGSLYDIGRDGALNHRVEIMGGVLAETSAALLKAFFRDRRKKRKNGGLDKG